MSVQTQIDRIVSNVTAAFTAIGSKGGTVPTNQTSDNLASAIDTIPEGVTVQTASGSVTTNSSGKATINCGFRPDLVVLYIGNFTNSGTTNESVLVLPIAERRNTSAVLDNVTWNGDSNLLECWLDGVTDAGITCYLYGYDTSWHEGYASRQTYSWKAVKYTA